LERKLTAILGADVYAYSRLMGEDEEGTLRTLSACCKISDSLIERHHGRFVNSAGDSVLAEFASVVEAVTCALSIQTELRAENAEWPLERRMQFNIGVNLGDVMVEGEQIYVGWSQRCGAAGESRRSRRYLHFRYGARTGARQTHACLRGSRRTGGQEHRASGASVACAARGRRALAVLSPGRFRADIGEAERCR